MNRKFSIIMITFLAVLIIASSVAVTSLHTAIDSDVDVFDVTNRHNYSFDALSERPIFITTTPNHLFDFTTDKIQSSFSHINLTFELKDGYTTFTAINSDPYIHIPTPKCTATEARYAVFCYRTEYDCGGEFYTARSDGENFWTPGGNTNWSWTASGEWEVSVVPMRSWLNSEEDVTFSSFRLDPLWLNVKDGYSIDIKYIALFATEEAANAFNFDEYMKKLAWEEEQKNLPKPEVDWPDPTYCEMETVAEDTNAGTLQYTISQDSKTVTITYDVNGETLSYTVPNNNNYLFGGYAGTDDLNRTLYDSNAVGSYGSTDERYIGLFYFLWHGEHGDYGVHDVQKIIDQVGVEAAGSMDCGLYGPEGSQHWFAEPLFGYYYANDAWVMRKHAELLTMANIDFLYFDVTNAVTYTQNAVQLMEILHELNEQGFDAPQVVFYTNTDSVQIVRDLYEAIYKRGLYMDTWFCINGKPVIVGEKEANIDDFFTMKQNQWPTEGKKTNSWPWMDFTWPQRVYPSSYDFDGGAISVSIAQHSGNCLFGDSALHGYYQNRGRSFTASGRVSNEILLERYQAWQADPSLTNYGLNFQAQWDRALDTNAMYILVTGWNEWIASSGLRSDGSISFVDTASMEFSRDAEMMRGGYFDNYYMQLIYNVQRAKGTAPIVVQDSRKPVNVTGEFDQWNDVAVTYSDVSGDTKHRDAIGYGKTPYVNTSGRNDIVSAKVTSDTQNLYFYVQTIDDITMFDTDSSWMQLYVDTDGSVETGWYGYDYIVNYRAKDTFTTTVAKYSGNDGGYGFTSVGEISYRAKDNQMMIAVPLEMLGIEGYKEINIQFKWADSTTTYDEMEDFYCDGDVAPLGRLNYVYQNYVPGVSQITYPEKETDAVTEPVTQPGSNETEDGAATAPNSSDTTDTTNEEKGGCASFIPGLAVMLPIVLLVPCRKHRKDE